MENTYVRLKKALLEHENIVLKILEDVNLIENIAKVTEAIIKSYEKGGALFLCGNGGSAADAQHISTELVSKFYLERKALNAEALNVNTSTMTAIANDYNYERIFARQVEAKIKIGDVLIGITTSGTSQNVIEAFKVAKERKALTIAFTGANTTMIKEYCDYVIAVPAMETPRIQEMHILIGHIICENIENTLFNKKI